MRTKREKAKGRRDRGSFVRMPHAFLRHPKFAQLSPRATKLLIDLCSGYTGNNNGDFSIAWRLMSQRGWRSKQQLYKAIAELTETGFVVKTRQGGKHKCSLYAITLWPIDECDGKLETPATTTASGTWKK
ncbi:MAG: hypothetical protein AAGF72_05605 [Pseudomonadota bacterium]